MNRRMNLAKDFSYIIMEILLMSVVYMLPQAIVTKGQSMNLWGFPFLCVIALSDYFLKIKCPNYILFLAGHLIPIPLVLALSFSLAEKITLTALIIIIFIGAVSYWKEEADTSRRKILDMSLISITLFVLADINCSLLKLPVLLRITLIMGIVFMVLFFLRFYLTNLQQFIDTNTGSKSIPFQKVFFMNTGCNIIMLLAALSLFLFVNLLDIGKLSAYLGYGLRYILKIILRLFQRKSAPDDLTAPENAVLPTPAPAGLTPPQDAQPNPLLMFLLKLLSYAVFIAFVAFLLYTVYRSIQYFMKRHLQKTDIIEFTEAIDGKPKGKKSGQRKVVPGRLAVKTNNQKIRRIYYNRIRYFQKCLVEVQHQDTPEEIKERIRSKTGCGVDKLTNLYEQARYADVQLNREDVEAAKKSKD